MYEWDYAGGINLNGTAQGRLTTVWTWPGPNTHLTTVWPWTRPNTTLNPNNEHHEHALILTLTKLHLAKSPLAQASSP